MAKSPLPPNQASIKGKPSGAVGEKRGRRKAIPQTDIPAVSMNEALRVARALGDEYAFASVSPLDAAKAVGMQPGSGPFRTLLSGSAAYGLTEGSAWAEKVSVTPLGRRIVRPTEEGDDMVARREALLKPRLPREFLKRYDGNKVPREDIARNVLEIMGVPSTETSRIFKQIISDARLLDLLTDINGIEYVRLEGAAIPRSTAAQGEAKGGDEALHGADRNGTSIEDASTDVVSPPASDASVLGDGRTKRVYVTHGKNKAFVDLLKKFLKYGDMEAVVSVEHETASIPVPEKVIGEMRTCGAAIIHVDAERTIKDVENVEHVVINENVLVEIGAAMALYGTRRFILLVKDGVTLPSNLQGLYKVKYSGDTLDADAAMKVLEAIADVKNHPLPVAASA